MYAGQVKWITLIIINTLLQNMVLNEIYLAAREHFIHKVAVGDM